MLAWDIEGRREIRGGSDSSMVINELLHNGNVLSRPQSFTECIEDGGDSPACKIPSLSDAVVDIDASESPAARYENLIPGPWPLP
jgi:hypothetical protein